MDNLEIIIPTYNRWQCLARTLEALAKSPFRFCRVTILDNCSTDNTKAAVSHWGEHLHCLYYIRHENNIGAERNYAHALSIARVKYVWILGDDDSYCWESGIGVEQEMLDEIINGEVDCILPGVSFDNLKVSGRHDLKELVYTDHPIFFATAFAPGLIVKTAHLDTEVINYVKAYADKGSLLPMYPLVRILLDRNALVYISPTKHIDKGHRHGYSTLAALNDWASIMMLSFYAKPMFKEMFSFPKIIPNIIICYLCDKPEGKFKRLWQLAFLVPRVYWFIWLGLIPLFIQKFIIKTLALSNYDENR